MQQLMPLTRSGNQTENAQKSCTIDGDKGESCELPNEPGKNAHFDCKTLSSPDIAQMANINLTVFLSYIFQVSNFFLLFLLHPLDTVWNLFHCSPLFKVKRRKCL